MDDEEEGGGEGWLVSYADLMTLLFAAFVVLYGITPQGESTEVLGVISSIRESFVEIPDEIEDDLRDKELFEGKKHFVSSKKDVILNQAIKKFNREDGYMNAEDLDFDEIDALLDKNSKGDGVQSSLRHSTKWSKDELSFRLVLVDRYYFPGADTKISLEGKRFLLDVGRTLKDKPHEILIESYTQFPPLSKFHSNLEISALRAQSLRNLWVKQLGISQERVQISAYGGMRATSKSGKKINQDNRIEVKILLR